MGIWQGALHAGTTSFRIVFHVSRDEAGTLAATMDSPDQGAAGIPVRLVETNGDTIALTVVPGSAAYEGNLQPGGQAIEGNWTQNGASFPITLGKVAAAPTVSRPQEPRPPFPYRVQDVSFPSSAPGVTLAGTITLPQGTGPFPAVVLATGSGPENRDEELFGHKPFLVLADHLTRLGVGVLRYDDRGVAESTGNYAAATTKDLAEDARSALEYLARVDGVDRSELGMIGHSEGTLIAGMVASESPLPSYLVLIGAPGFPGDHILLEQSAAMLRTGGADEQTIRKAESTNEQVYKVIETTPDDLKAAEVIRPILEQSGFDETAIRAQLQPLLTPWYRYFLNYDPRPALGKVEVPVLAVWGSKDLQVPPEDNRPAVEEALRRGGNTHVTARVLDGLNHLLQPAKTGLPQEYAQIQTTIAPEALDLIGGWIRGQSDSGR